MGGFTSLGQCILKDKVWMHGAVGDELDQERTIHHIVDPMTLPGEEIDAYYAYFDDVHGAQSSLHVCAAQNRSDLDPNICREFMFPQALLSYKTVEARQFENIESKEVADLQRFYPKKRIDAVDVPQMVLNRRNFGWDPEMLVAAESSKIFQAHMKPAFNVHRSYMTFKSDQ